ncbi:MAG: hypothetical protein LBJ82_04780 [Deltaproteobacteria bacterium]|jgi:hypothetical protein|nr:hypothetical protein [Deltaproteobacteria bacterium]
MPVSNVNAEFSPNVGIERIMEAEEGPGLAALPSSARVLPTDAMTGTAALDDLYASTWDRAMMQFLRPRIEARELLIPGVFAGHIRRAQREMAEEARRRKSPALRNAVLLMEEDEEMKNLLEIYRNLLMQG